jgi:hypothetical protein
VLIGGGAPQQHLPPGVAYAPQPPAIYGGSEFHSHQAAPSQYDFDDETPQQMHMNDAHPHHHQPGNWKHGLCGCDCCTGPCCASFWCNAMQTAKLHSLSNGDRPPAACQAKASTFWMLGGMALVLVGDIAASAAPAVASLGGVGVALLVAQHMVTRFRIVSRLGVTETCCCTCMTSFFCAPCSSVQMTDSLVSNGEPAARLFMD